MAAKLTLARTLKQGAMLSPGPLAAICLGYFMVILDAMVVTVALPSIGRQLGVSVAGLQWVTAGYTLAFAGLLLSAGALGDQYGPKRVFQAGLAVFAAASGAPVVLAGFGAAAAAAVALRRRRARRAVPDASARDVRQPDVLRGQRGRAARLAGGRFPHLLPAAGGAADRDRIRGGFVAGMHVCAAVAGAAFLAGCGLSAAAVERRPGPRRSAT